MGDDAARRLEKAIKTEIEKAKKLIDTDEATALSDLSLLDGQLHIIESYSKLRTAIKPASRGRTAVALILIVSASIVLVLSSIKKSGVHILLQIQASAIRGQLDEPWPYDKPFDLKRSVPRRQIRLTNESGTVTLAGPRQCTLSQSSLIIACETLQVTQLRLAKDTQIEMALHKDTVTLSIKGGEVKGRLEFQGTAGVYEDDLRRRQLCTVNTDSSSTPETISFNLQATGAVPAIIETDTTMFLGPLDLKLRELHFSQEQPLYVGSDFFQSTVTNGTITVYEAAKHHTLRQKERVTLKDLQTKWLELSIADEILVNLEATVGEIKVGPAGLEKNLAPSILEYLYREQTLALLWGSIGFLSALMFRFRKTFFE